MKNITPNKNSVTTKNSLTSKGGTLAALSLPALLLTFGLSTSDLPETDVIVAAGTEVSVAEIAATHECVACPPFLASAE